MTIAPLQSEIPYNQIVVITDPDLTVSVDIDFSDSHTQIIPFNVVEKKHR